MALPNIQVITRKDSLINPINFELPYKSLLYLNERHDKAQEAIGKNAAALGPLLASVHESERPAVMERFNSYMDKMNSNIDPSSGYAGNALSDSIRLGQEAAGDYFFIGRALDNKKYEDWKNNIQNRTDLDQKTKDYFIKHTPYYHYDQYEGEGIDDAKENREREAQNLLDYKQNPELYVATHGNVPKQHSPFEKIIGGTTWNAERNPVSKVNITELMEKVASIVRPNGITGDGKLQYDPVTGYFFQDGTKKVGVSKERLKAAFISAINGTPGARESISQDLEVGLGTMFDNAGIFGTDLSDKKYGVTERGTFVDKNGNPIDNEFTDKEGLPLSIDKYIDSIIDPMAKALAYSDITQNRKYIAPPKQSDSSGNKGNKSGGNNSEENSNGDTGSYEGPTVEKMFENANSNKMIMQKSAAIMRDLANQAGIDPDVYGTPQELKNAMRGSGKMTPQFVAAYQAFEESQNKILNNFGTQETPNADADEMLTAINTGLGIPSSSQNIYARNYNDILNGFYNVGSTSLPAIYIKTTHNNKDYTREIEQEFGESLENYFDVQEGYIEINSEDRYLIPRLYNAFLKVNENNKSFSPKAGGSSLPSSFGGLNVPFETYAYNDTDNSYTNTENIKTAYNTAKELRSSVRDQSLILPNILSAIKGLSKISNVFNDSSVSELHRFINNIKEEDKKANEEFNSNNLYDKNQVNTVVRPWTNLLDEYELPDMTASDRNLYGNKIIQSVVAYNPRNATEYYVTNHDYNDINTNVTDASQRLNIQKILQTIYATEPNRIKFGYDDVTGDPIIKVYGGNHNYDKAEPIPDNVQNYISSYNDAFDIVAPFAGDQAFKKAMMSRYDLYGAFLIHRAKGSNMETVPMFNGTAININGDKYGNLYLDRSQIANLIGSREDWKILQNAMFTSNLDDTDILNGVLNISNKLYANLKIPNENELKILQDEANKFTDPVNRVLIMLEGFRDYTNDNRWSIILKTFNDIQ